MSCFDFVRSTGYCLGGNSVKKMADGRYYLIFNGVILSRIGSARRSDSAESVITALIFVEKLHPATERRHPQPALLPPFPSSNSFSSLLDTANRSPAGRPSLPALRSASSHPTMTYRPPSCNLTRSLPGLLPLSKLTSPTPPGSNRPSASDVQSASATPSSSSASSNPTRSSSTTRTRPSRASPTRTCTPPRRSATTTSAACSSPRATRTRARRSTSCTRRR